MAGYKKSIRNSMQISNK